MKDITKKDFNSWKNQIITKTFFQYMIDKRFDIMENWAAGSYTHESIEGTAQKNAEAIAQCSVYLEVPHIEYDEIMALYDSKKREKDIGKE